MIKITPRREMRRLLDSDLDRDLIGMEWVFPCTFCRALFPPFSIGFGHDGVQTRCEQYVERQRHGTVWKDGWISRSSHFPLSFLHIAGRW